MRRFTILDFRFTSGRSRHTFYLLLIIFYSLLFTATAVHAQEVTDDDVNEVAKGLYCPVCESTPLDVCPTQACADWRELIRTQLESGMSQQEIFNYFATNFGDGVLATPPRSGFGLLLWLFPLLALAVGGVVFARALRGLRAAAPAPAANDGTTAVATPKADLNHYIQQIEAELEEANHV